MNRWAYILLFILSLALIEAHAGAQNRKSGARSGAPVSKGENVQKVDLSSSERDKEIADCEIPERPKPQGEIKKVSQLCGHAISLPKAAYPEEAKSKRVAGTVEVNVVTNEEGRVIWAKAVSGPELLYDVSMKAACRARYSPTLISGRAIKTENTIGYVFVLP